MRFGQARSRQGEPFVPEESREDAANLPDPPDWGSGCGRAMVDGAVKASCERTLFGSAAGHRARLRAASRETAREV